MQPKLKNNYQALLDEKLKEVASLGVRPSLLLHACCAPCSSYVIEYLSNYFDITLLYYNPNISPEDEYLRRSKELERLVSDMEGIGNVRTVTEKYSPKDFDKISRGLENIPEGGERCLRCYRLRLEYAARYAQNNNYDYFCTTLSISPLKNAEALNKIGSELSLIYGVSYLLSDFKKKNGYQRSCELSEKYGLYRQNYCGCRFSALEAEKRNKHS